LYNLVRLADAFDQPFVFGFEELQKRPDGDVLEGRVPTGEEAAEVAVDTASGFRPVLDEDGVVADYDG
jgi:hypothetical protein